MLHGDAYPDRPWRRGDARSGAVDRLQQLPGWRDASPWAARWSRADAPSSTTPGTSTPSLSQVRAETRRPPAADWYDDALRRTYQAGDDSATHRGARPRRCSRSRSRASSTATGEPLRRGLRRHASMNLLPAEIEAATGGRRCASGSNLPLPGVCSPPWCGAKLTAGIRPEAFRPRPRARDERARATVDTSNGSATRPGARDRRR